MKKEIIIAIVVLIILLVPTGIFLANHNKKIPASLQQPKISTQPTEQKQNIFNSITDALTKRLSLSCDFTTDQGTHIVSSVKNGSVRADISGKTPQESGSVIIKDKKIYFWNVSIAMMMNEPEITVTPIQGQNAASQEQNIMDNMEKYKQYCHEALISDSQFDLPGNVKFTDTSKMMIPSGIPGNSQAIPSVNYQQYMQQYQNKMPHGQ